MNEDPKKTLRAEMRSRLGRIETLWRDQASAAAAERLIQTEEYQRAAVVMMFVSFPTEIDTLPLARDAWSRGKRVLVPRAHMHDRSMECVAVTSFTDNMATSRFGVREPTRGEVVDPAEIDLVVTPGLAFGPSGERLGHGAGFYDRFLRHRATRAVACGYAFELQVITGIPMLDWDTPIDLLVTEHQIRRFAPRLP